MNNRIAQALANLFDRHRIVFWYDAKKELRNDFEALSLPGVEKLELANNEFGVKHKILREQPTQKFLLYREGRSRPTRKTGCSTFSWLMTGSAPTKRPSGYPNWNSVWSLRIWHRLMRNSSGRSSAGTTSKTYLKKTTILRRFA